MKYRNIIFDLDGTLVDSSQGICNSMRYALKSMGLDENSEVKSHIGPPLLLMINEIVPDIDEQKAINLGEIFRQRYSEKGICECELYADVEETLRYLSSKGHELYIVTSKPEKFAIEIVENLKIVKYFKQIVGTKLELNKKGKAENIRYLVESMKLDIKDSIMVGDRQEDITAARDNGIQTIAVTYGYGKREDLIECESKMILEGFAELKRI